MISFLTLRSASLENKRNKDLCKCQFIANLLVSLSECTFKYPTALPPPSSTTRTNSHRESLIGAIMSYGPVHAILQSEHPSTPQTPRARSQRNGGIGCIRNSIIIKKTRRLSKILCVTRICSRTRGRCWDHRKYGTIALSRVSFDI